MKKTYSHCTWQDGTLNEASIIAEGNIEHLTSLGTLFGLFDYPAEVENKGKKITKTALQHLENNDHFIFICKFETISNYEEFDRLFKETNLDHWNKLQPYLIGLFIAKGIPMLWQGQEFGENDWVPKKGQGRVLFVQTCALEYFYALEGKYLSNFSTSLTRN